jgi:hypothetical protein
MRAAAALTYRKGPKATPARLCQHVPHIKRGAGPGGASRPGGVGRRSLRRRPMRSGSPHGWTCAPRLSFRSTKSAPIRTSGTTRSGSWAFILIPRVARDPGHPRTPRHLQSPAGVGGRFRGCGCGDVGLWHPARRMQRSGRDEMAAGPSRRAAKETALAARRRPGRATKGPHIGPQCAKPPMRPARKRTPARPSRSCASADAHTAASRNAWSMQRMLPSR